MTARPDFFTCDLHKNTVADTRRAKKIIGKFIHDRRFAKDMTPEQLSRRSGVSVRVINQIELGKGPMEWGIVARLALCLGRPLSEFLWDGE